MQVTGKVNGTISANTKNDVSVPISIKTETPASELGDEVTVTLIVNSTTPYTKKIEVPVRIAIKQDPFKNLTIGEAKNQDKYGYKVKGYDATTEEFKSGIWRLFYQDANYTYLITDELVGKYNLSDYYMLYQNGADVSSVGQKLSPMIKDLFTESNTNGNVRSTAWLTDTEAEEWSKYAQGDAVFAIGSPTAELFAKSYNSNTNKSVRYTITLTKGTYGYGINTSDGWLKKEDSHGIYNKDGKSNWWLASPGNSYAFDGRYVYGSTGDIYGSNINSNLCAVRPVVAIPTDTFDNSGKYWLVNDFNASNFSLGEAKNTDKYGYKVTNYNVEYTASNGATSNVWRLFYQDSNYTYLIADELVGNYKPRDYYDAEGSPYKTGADVRTVGQKLSPIITDLFTSSNTNANIRSTAWLTDPEAKEWSKYAQGDAVFAIGSPTAELFAASYNSNTNKSVSNTIILRKGTYGYAENTNSNWLKKEDSHGIYNKDGSSFWWLASPGNNMAYHELSAGGVTGYFGNHYVGSDSRAIRPVVAIPTSKVPDTVLV